LSNPPLETVSAALPDATTLDGRRRRAIYRATYRGTKEMDWLLGRYASAQVPGMSDTELTLFEQAIVIPDPDFHAWIIDPGPVMHGPFATLIAEIRAFHKLDAE
jgi:antitoxin CptB